ncbi:hypothetical protein LUZ60_004316 [Juncus effusus]|nr:hypothetical protein LUZ60_004316 [Juncus effusus]
MADPSASSDQLKQQQEEEQNPNKPNEPNSPSSASRGRSPMGVLSFWFYLTISVAVLSFLLAPLLTSTTRQSWFLSLPAELRHHFSQGKLVKIHPPSPHNSFRLFTVDFSPEDYSETVLLLPGLACNSFSFRSLLLSLQSHGLRAVSLDPPGSGFSETPKVYNALTDAYNQIKEKGIFWAFDQMVQTGQAPYEEILARKSFSPYGPAETSFFIQQIIKTMNLAPVHLILHDSSLPAGANFISSYPSLIRSVTLLDSSAQIPAFPSWILQIPVLSHLILKSPSLFTKLMSICCSRTINGDSTEAQRLLLTDGRKAVVEAAKALNYSFDLRDLKEMESVKNIPFFMLWSNNWSDRWIEEGKKVKFSVPDGKFVYHSGGRWAQEDNVDEITERIVEFVTSLPKSVRKDKNEDLEENKESDFEGQNGHFGQHHDHNHGYPLGFNMGMYGL